MIATRLSRSTFCGLVGLGAVCLAFSLASTAQVQTSRSSAVKLFISTATALLSKWKMVRSDTSITSRTA